VWLGCLLLSRDALRAYTTRMYLVSNLAVWLVAIVCGIIAESLAVTHIFGISTYVASFGGKPEIWLSRFFEPAVSLTALTAWLWLRGEDWHSLGLRKPTSWRRFATQIILTVLVVQAVIWTFIFAIASPFHFHIAPLPDIRDRNTLAAALAFTLLGTGLNQELLFRGFLLNRLAKAFGGAWRGAIVASSIVFGLFHLPLGAANAVEAGLAGVFLGEMYLRAEKNLWVVVVAHSVLDAIGLMYGYWSY